MVASPKKSATVSRRPRVVTVGFPDDFKPTPAHELTDLATLPRRFDLFAGEMRDALAAIGREFLPIMNRVEASVAGVREDIAVIRGHISDLETKVSMRFEKLEAEVADLAKRTHAAEATLREIGAARATKSRKKR
jgi:hypothetical protein